jgi:hypothetical protein
MVLAGLVLLLLFGVAVVAAGAGPMVYESGRSQVGLVGTGSEPGLQTEQGQPETEEEEQQTERNAAFDAVIDVIMLGSVLAVLGALVLTTRFLARTRGDERPAESVDEQALMLSHDDVLGGELRQAAEHGAEMLRSARPGGRSRDAVISCWLRLESAAAVAGGGRHPAQTPSEFTVQLLAARSVDRDSLDLLLRLYQRARFGSAALPEAATAQALGALERVAADLSAPQAASDLSGAVPTASSTAASTASPRRDRR